MSYDVPHLRVPVSLGGKRFATVEQDSIEEVEQCVEAVVRTPLGHRDIAPEFGIPDQAFDVNPQALHDAIDECEPRADTTIEREDVEDLYTIIHLDTDLEGTE